MIYHILSIKRGWQYLPRIGRYEFFKNNAAKFPTLHHLSIEHDILMTVTINRARSDPMETRHPEISKDTNFEEIRALEDFQTAAQKQDQKEEKAENRI